MKHIITVCLVITFLPDSTALLWGNDVVRVEEDWQLQVAHPDQELDAPQVTTTIVPFAAEDGLLLQVDLNHASNPSFSNGGIQLRVCQEDDCLAQLRLFDDMRFQYEGETICWTQVVHSNESGFYFGIINGISQTWGTFGGQEAFLYLSNSEAGGGNLSLDQYDPRQSAANSGVTYASNRVGYLRLWEARVYTNDGQTHVWRLSEEEL